MGKRTCDQPTVEGGRCRNGPGCTVDHKGQMAAFQAGVNTAAAAAAAAGPGGDPFTVRVIVEKPPPPRRCAARGCVQMVPRRHGQLMCDPHERELGEIQDARRRELDSKRHGG